MKRIIIVVMFFFLLAGTCILGGCEGADFMDTEDKQPHIVLINYKASPTELGGGTPSYYQEYGFRRETWTDPVSLLKMEQDIPLAPLSVSRFEVTIESYHINQDFNISIVFPDVGFPAYRITMHDPFKSAAPIYTSNHGHGPGGYLTATVALWSPREEVDGVGDYNLSVVVTGADGYDAYADIGFVVKKIIVKEVDLDEED